MANERLIVTKGFTVGSLYKKVSKGTVDTFVSIQRSSGRWPNLMKGNLISDILQGNPIPPLVFATQDGRTHTLVMDGVQRLTTAVAYKNNKFSISKSVTRGEITYVKDDNTVETFDIRGKKFKQLPEELQELFDDYTFRVDVYNDCSNEELEYHMERLNAGVKMNASEKGMIRLGVVLANHVRELIEMPFFGLDHTNYKTAERNNGTLQRVVVESIMASYDLEHWNKKPETMCEYLNANADDELFERFENTLDRLESVMSEEARELFNSKNSFLFFATFERFKKLGLEDEKFVEFLEAFKESLHASEINGESFDSLMEKTRANKDKLVVIERLNHLEALLKEYFGVSEIPHLNKEKTENDLKAIYTSEMEKIPVVSMNGNPKEIARRAMALFKDSETEDVEFTEDDMNDVVYCTNCLESFAVDVNNETKLFDESNIPGLIIASHLAMTEDSVEEIDFRKWFGNLAHKFEEDSTFDFSGDYKERALAIMNDFHKFIDFVFAGRRNREVA